MGGDIGNYQLNLNADKLDLDALSGWQPKTAEQTAQSTQSITSAPVIARDVDEQPNGLSIQCQILDLHPAIG